MLQKEPLQTRNLKIDRRSEQPAEFEDRSSNPNFPMQNFSLGESDSQQPKTKDEIMSKPISRGPVVHPFLEQSTDPNTIEDNIQFNTDFLQELERLENLVIDSVRVPLTELVVIDETLILARIESIRNQIPGELAIAINILERKQEILFC